MTPAVRELVEAAKSVVEDSERDSNGYPQDPLVGQLDDALTAVLRAEPTHPAAATGEEVERALLVMAWLLGGHGVDGGVLDTAMRAALRAMRGGGR